MSPPVDLLVAQLTLAEKAGLLAGVDLWHTGAVERLGIPALTVTDGPNGARGDGIFGTGTRSLCIPCGSALGATWNPALVEELGRALGHQARTKGAHVLLAPTVNLHRTPLGGRNFECYSEDPHLTARLAVGFVRGVQSEGVATTTKHLAGNDSEFERHTIDSLIDERTLREITLAPFEAVVTEADAWGLMAAYNRLNGHHCTEHAELLGAIVRDEWGFDGVVVSDWFACRSTAGSIDAGLDLEMPGPPAVFGEALVAAVEAGEVAESTLDGSVRRLLTLMERTGAFDGQAPVAEIAVDLPEHRALARRAAAEATVLLRNDGLLPLDATSLGSIAVIGANADRAQIMGGGSAALRPHHTTTPLSALRARLGDRVEIAYERGCDIDRTIPPLGGRRIAGDGVGPVRVEIHDGYELAGPVVLTRHQDDLSVVFLGGPGDGVDPEAFSFRASTTFTPDESGAHTFTLVQAGRARLLVDGAVVLDGTVDPPGPGNALFGMGSAEIATAVDLDAGRPVEVVLEGSARESVVVAGAVVGLSSPRAGDLVDRAAALAGASDVAVVVVGTNDDWETEGRDRESLGLPGDQDELVRRVAAVNPRTVVVVNAGSPVALPWVGSVAAVLDIWFGGQEMADALVDVLLGEVSPSGKLPTTFPRRLADTPAFTSYPGENGRVRYAEGLFWGHRWYDARDIDPAFCFGHGLSYTTFALAEPVVSDTVVSDTTLVEQPVVVGVDVTNTGDRAGAEVVQCYVAPRSPRLARPPRELKAFTKVRLEPGETQRVELVLDRRAFAHYDPGDPTWAERNDGRPVPAGHTTDHRAESGWYVDPGDYDLHIGVSSRDIRHVVTVELTDVEGS